MSAKLTIIFFILICFEIGVLLIILPWVPNPSWGENYLLVIAADNLRWPSLAMAIKSGYVRGAVTGLGVLNILLGVWEIINFKKTARAFQVEWQGEEVDPKSLEAARIPDNGPLETPTPEQSRDATRPD
ncbi:MAG TPA: hypothetical protein VNI02_11205 [Blastocatellia bacterium]|jgi:hypothetical protein|nr:hypothetical protein [Blastocatellia bacterium]